MRFGLPASCGKTTILPATASMEGFPRCLTAIEIQFGSGMQSESVKAIIVPDAASIPVFLAEYEPPICCVSNRTVIDRRAPSTTGEIVEPLSMIRTWSRLESSRQRVEASSQPRRSFLTGSRGRPLEAVRSSSRNLKLRSSQTRRGGDSTEYAVHNYTYNVGIERMAGADTRVGRGGRTGFAPFRARGLLRVVVSRGDR